MNVLVALRRLWGGDPSTSRRSGQLWVSNTDADDLILRLEPWADETVIPPGGRARVTFVGPGKADIQVDVAQGTLVIYGWIGSTLDVDAALGSRP